MFPIRDARQDDFHAICSLIKSKEELFLVYPAGKFPFTVDQVVDLSKARKELTVATDGDKIIGFANLYDFKPGKHAYIGNVVVDENYRGQGLGKQIILYMLDIAFKKLDLPEIKISVFSENTPAMSLYSRLGFLPFESEERIDPDGNRVALVHMKMCRK